MISEQELIAAINDIEHSGATLRNCEKLSALYIIYDHLYDNDRQPMFFQRSAPEMVVDSDIQSDFMDAVRGKNAADVWGIIAEMADAVSVLQPRLYQSTIDRINDLTNP